MHSSEMSNPLGPVGVVGLGNMGSAMAIHLLKAGFEVIGTDLVEEYRDVLTNAGGTALANAQEVGKRCRHIILSLPSEGALYKVCADLAASCAKGTIILETSTMPLAAKEKVRDTLAEKGVILLDTPLAGTSAQAKNRDLAVYASGDTSAIQEVVPIMEGFARAYYDLGEFGNGTKMKLVNNHLVTIHNVAAAEGLLLGERLGLDPETVVKVVGDGSGSSRMLQVRGPLMARRAWDIVTATNTVHLKDIRIIGEAIQAVGSPAPLFWSTLPIYTSAIASGYAKHDTATVFAVLERMTKAIDSSEN